LLNTLNVDLPERHDDCGQPNDDWILRFGEYIEAKLGAVFKLR